METSVSVLGPTYASIGADVFLILGLAIVLGIIVLALPIYRSWKMARRARRRPRPGSSMLEPGAVYAVPNEEPPRAFQILTTEVRQGAKGLVISRVHPDALRARYDLESTTALWLSRSFGQDAVNPTNLVALAHEIERFVSGKENSIVLIDDLDYLISQTDRIQVARFVQSLVKIGDIHNSRLVLAFDGRSVPSTDEILREVHTV